MDVPAWEGVGKYTWYFAQMICIAGALISLWALYKTWRG